MPRRILFIINPIAGAKIRRANKATIKRVFAHSDIQYDIIYTEYAGHGRDLAKKVVQENSYDTIAVAGGDGTVNEIATELIHSTIKFGLLPTGSGNGLAHHLNIPLNVQKALEVIKQGHAIKMDTGKVTGLTDNSCYFFSNCGFGYDAEVIHSYDAVDQRGFFTYLYFLIQSINTLNPKMVRIQMEGFDENIAPFVFTVANSSQYGYKIKVAPQASVQDGLLDSLLVRKANVMHLLKFAGATLIDQDDIYQDVAEYNQSQWVKLNFEEETKFQVDGEPFIAKNEVSISIIPQALNILVPRLS